MDVFDKKKRSWIMSRIRAKGTKPEEALFALIKDFYRKGYRYRRHAKNVFGHPDLIFPKQKIAVFVDSEFWHGKSFTDWRERLPKKYWIDKIERNIKRDKEVNRSLKLQGWRVIRIWSKPLMKKPEVFIDKIRRVLERKADGD
jgi:DNA mismatch endonuclease (patch repair protein)